MSIVKKKALLKLLVSTLVLIAVAYAVDGFNTVKLLLAIEFGSISTVVAILAASDLIAEHNDDREEDGNDR